MDGSGVNDVVWMRLAIAREMACRQEPYRRIVSVSEEGTVGFDHNIYAEDLLRQINDRLRDQRVGARRIAA